MHASHEAAIGSVLAHQHGCTDHPQDPGGPPNWGTTISRRASFGTRPPQARTSRSHALVVAQQIYEKHYWGLKRCDELPAGLDYSMFDYGVNTGTSRSGKVLRRLLGPDDTSAITRSGDRGRRDSAR